MDTLKPNWQSQNVRTKINAYRYVGWFALFAFLVAITIAFALDLAGKNPFLPPFSTLILNIIFIIIIGFALAAISAISFIRTGNLAVLLLGTAFLIGALASIAAGLTGPYVSTNADLTTHNVGFIVVSGLQALSAIIVLLHVRTAVESWRKESLIIAYVLAIAFMGVWTAVTVFGLTPAFYSNGAPTFIRQVVVGITIILFSVGFSAFLYQYLKTKSVTLYMYSLALGFFAIGFLALILQMDGGDIFGWIGRTAQYLGAVIFLIALLQVRREAKGQGSLPEKWADTFRTDKRQFATLFANMLSAFIYCKIVIDKNGEPVDWIYLDLNVVWEKISGVKKEVALGRKVTELFPEETKDTFDWIGKYGHVALSGEPAKFEAYRRSFNKWLSASVYSPKKGYFVSIFEDITERKKTEEELRKAEASRIASVYARSLIEASVDPLVTISADGKITDVNKASELATGCSREEMIGSDFSDYFTDPEKARMGYQRVFSEGVVKDYPLTIRHKSGKITEVLYNATVYRNDAGEVQGVFAAARDITELKKAEKQAEESMKKLHDAERLAAIGATAGMVGHDIRNPLQAITSDVYLAKTDLEATPNSEEKKSALESLQGIEDNVVYINKIVQDLQDYARPITPVAKETDIELLCRDFISKSPVPNGIDFSCQAEKKMNIMSDPDLIKRILTNLITNAIQAMPNGGKLYVRVRREGKETVLTVEDTGVGIPKQDRSKLFTPMFTTKSKGQGFGLAVVKRLTEALGGTVVFESEIGKGTKFTVRLPSQRAKR